MNHRINAVLVCFVISLFLPTTTSEDNKGPDVNTGTTTTKPPLSLRLDEVGLFKDSYSKRVHGRLHVKVKHVTTSSIHVDWNLPEMTFHDSVLEANVICETSNGFMISKTHVSSPDTYQIEHLHANTSYIVCVYMLEKSESSQTTVLHYSCEESRTNPHIHIPSLRTDSIIAVVVTFGYIIVMIIIGYASWKWKIKKKMEDESREKLAIEEEDVYEDGAVNGGLGGGYRYADGGGSDYRIDGDEYDDDRSRKEKGSLRTSSRLLNNYDGDDGGGSSRGNGNGTVTFSESDVMLEKTHWKHNSADEVNGCLDFGKRTSRGSAPKLSELTETKNFHSDTRRPKSMDDSPVKVTEISF